MDTILNISLFCEINSTLTLGIIFDGLGLGGFDVGDSLVFGHHLSHGVGFVLVLARVQKLYRIRIDA